MMASPFSQRRITSWVAAMATLAALVALLVSSLATTPSALAKIYPGASASSPLSPHDPRTPAQKRYDAWLTQQQAKFETPANRQAALAYAAKLPKWKANAHEVTTGSHALPHGAISPHVALPVTTDPNNWTALGPAPVSYFGNTYSGDVSAISSSATNANDVWIATAVGGVWHSTDGGATWTATTDTQPTLSFGAIAVDPTDDSVIFAGSNDPSGYNSNSYPGVGIFKSVNSGATWTQEDATDFAGMATFKIAIDPSNDQNILAAVGTTYDYSPANQAGLWRSTNGGSTWAQVLADSTNSDYTAAVSTDVVFDPSNSAVVYAALGNLSGSSSTTSPQGIYKSTNHGATWALLTGTNAPTGQDVGRVSLGISHDGAHLYAAIGDSGFSNSANDGALLNSSLYEYNTGANTWATVSLTGSVLDTNGELSSLGWNTTVAIAVAPTDSTGATIYLGQDYLYRSTNSGATWAQQGAFGVGFGQESIYFPSASSSNYYVGNTEGIWQYASGVFTSKNTNLNISAATNGAYGDNGAYSPLYAELSGEPIYGVVQYPTGATGTAGWTYNGTAYAGVTVDWSNNANVYTPYTTCSDISCTTTTTTIQKSGNGGTSFAPTSLSTTDAVGYSVPPTISAIHAQTLFYGTTRVWATTNGGSAWSPISPQLDTTPQFGTCTGLTDTGCPFITQIAVSPTTDSEILVVYSDSTAYETTNGGASWFSVAPLCAGQTGCTNGYVLYAISPSNPLTIYAAGWYNSSSTFANGVFVSTNGGHGWSLQPNSPQTPFISSIAISPTNPHLIIISTNVGAAISTDDGVDWASVSGLPNASTTSVFFSHDGSQMLVTTRGRGVWAIAMPHMTSSPQAVTLTTDPGSSPADQLVTLHNTGQGTLSWSTSGLPAWLGVSPPSGSIPAGGSTNITLSFNTPSLTPQTYSTMLTLSGNGDNANIDLPITVSSSLAKTWYFAEGYTGGSFTEYLTLANPNPTSANVSVQYLLQGQPPVTKNYSVNANSRKTLNVNTELGQGIGVSMVVTSDLPIVAERPMYFTFTGAGLNVPGGTDVLGATRLGTQFDFGYLDTTANHATYLTVLNQNNNSMDVTVNYYAAAGGAPTTVLHSVPANSRGTILVNDDVPSGSYSALVTLSVAGLVERPMYLTDATTGYTGSADVIGVQQPTTSWSFAEGYTSPTFSERYILSNPGSVAATATVTFLKSDGSTTNANVNLNPGQQQIVDANAILGNGVNNSATVTSDQPILAERFMSFTYTGPVGVSGSGHILGATDVLGAGSVGTVYAFAEGYTGGSFAEYLTLENPNATTTQVTVVYLPQNGGAPTLQTYFVAAHSRYTVLTNRVMSNQSFSMLVLADQPIVAERPMYFNYNAGQTGGSDVLGYKP